MPDMDSSTPMEAENVEFALPTENSNGNGGTVRRSASLGALALALAKSQLEFEVITKDTENPYYRSRYAELSSIIAATQKALAKNGLVIIQSPIVNVESQKAGVSSLMVHSSGEWIMSDLVLPATMLGKDGRPRFDAQSCGSAQTYARRYTYQALIGVAAEPDDDGNKGVGIGSREEAQAVGQRKVEELRAKAKNSNAAALDPVPSLFYVWHDESQSAEITGAESLKKLNKDILSPLWNGAARALIANAEQLEALKYQLEKRGCPFTALKAAHATSA